MFRKIVLAVSVLVCLVILNISALSVNLDFYVYSEDADRVCEILGMTKEQIDEYCENNAITYLAVDKDNSRQIRKIEISDNLSKEILDLSILDDKKIFALSDELSGFENTNGSIVKKNDLKFYKTEYQSKDSGGEYAVTQYVTVQNAKKTVLTFHTQKDLDRNYIDSVIAELFKPETDQTPFLTSGMAIFGVIGIVVLVLIIKDLKKE